MDPSLRATVPVRDTHAPGTPVVFVLEFYGADARELCSIQVDGPMDPNIGSYRIVRALQRRGFDPDRYRPFLWDIY